MPENEIDKIIEGLSEKEVWDFVQFARVLNNFYGGSYSNPDLINMRMKEIGMNPSAASESELAKALVDPKNSEETLQRYSQSFEVTSMIYKRLLSYLSNILAFDVTYTSNAKPDDYKTPKYKKDSEVVDSFLEKFNYKYEFSIAIREMLRNDAYFGVFRDTGDAFVLQELPSDYCKITGKWHGGFLFSFNMDWFALPGVDINMYPPFFKKKYNEIWGKNTGTSKYNPSLGAEMRGKSSWLYWVDVPVDLGVCFKLTPEIATRLPFFTPLFSDLVLQPLIRNLQKAINGAVANKMLIGEVPMNNRDVKATIKDAIAVSPEILAKFLALLKSVIGDFVKVGAAPLTNIRGVEFKAENEMYDSYLGTMLATTGVNSNLVFTSNIKPNTIETQLSLNVDELMMEALYPQFDAFMTYQINTRTRNFKFRTVFEGTNFYLNRGIRHTNAMALFDKGIILPQKIAASLGMKPSELRKQMEESKANGFMDMITPPSFEQQKQMADITQKAVMEQQKQQGEMNQAAMIAKQEAAGATGSSGGSAGRPKKKDSELSEEGATTRAQGTNVGRGGKTP